MTSLLDAKCTEVGKPAELNLYRGSVTIPGVENREGFLSELVSAWFANGLVDLFTGGVERSLPLQDQQGSSDPLVVDYRQLGRGESITSVLGLDGTTRLTDVFLKPSQIVQLGNPDKRSCLRDGKFFLPFRAVGGFGIAQLTIGFPNRLVVIPENSLPMFDDVDCGFVRYCITGVSRL